MVFIAYIIDKYVHNQDAVIFMKSYGKEDEAYLSLGRELKKQPDYIRDWLEDIVEDINSRFKPLEEAVTKNQNYEYKITNDPQLMKLFCQYYNHLESFGPSDGTFIHFGVEET